MRRTEGVELDPIDQRIGLTDLDGRTGLRRRQWRRVQVEEVVRLSPFPPTSGPTFTPLIRAKSPAGVIQISPFAGLAGGTPGVRLNPPWRHPEAPR